MVNSALLDRAEAGDFELAGCDVHAQTVCVDRLDRRPSGFRGTVSDALSVETWARCSVIASFVQQHHQSGSPIDRMTDLDHEHQQLVVTKLA